MSLGDEAQDLSKARRRPLYYFLILTLGVGAIASLFTTQQIPGWYNHLLHPAFAPPDWVFAPVWTLLYVLMAISAWRVWQKTGLKSLAMTSFALQLALNFTWSVLFFALHQIGMALVEILVLDLAILVTALLFFRHDRVAGLLFLAYLAWMAFASLLTHSFWRLNGG
jgi:translocator protein